MATQNSTREAQQVRLARVLQELPEGDEYLLVWLRGPGPNKKLEVLASGNVDAKEGARLLRVTAAHLEKDTSHGLIIPTGARERAN